MKSIITEYTENCLLCGKPNAVQHHLIFGNSSRGLADEDELIIPLCNECHTSGLLISRIHDNPCAEKLSKMLGQMAYEKHLVADGKSEKQARECFRKRYGRSFL